MYVHIHMYDFCLFFVSLPLIPQHIKRLVEDPAEQPPAVGRRSKVVCHLITMAHGRQVVFPAGLSEKDYLKAIVWISVLPRKMLSPSFNVPGFVNTPSQAAKRCQSSVISCRLGAHVCLPSTRGGQGQWRGNWIRPSGPVRAKPGCGLELSKELLWPTSLAEHLSGFLPHSAFICPMFLVFETHTAEIILDPSD